jgi:hypothetical protein
MISRNLPKNPAEAWSDLRYGAQGSSCSRGRPGPNDNKALDWKPGDDLRVRSEAIGAVSSHSVMRIVCAILSDPLATRHSLT